jgi:hypothetical protein
MSGGGLSTCAAVLEAFAVVLEAFAVVLEAFAALLEAFAPTSQVGGDAMPLSCRSRFGTSRDGRRFREPQRL